jgi:hypothetical protein
MGIIMEKERNIQAVVVQEECWISEFEKEFILSYRNADDNIKNAVHRLLKVEDIQNPYFPNDD